MEEELKVEDVKVSEENVSEKPEPKKKKTATVIHGHVVNCKGLNLRAEPNLSAAILEILRPGDDFTIVKKNSTEDFYNIIIESIPGKNISGFALKKYIEINSK